MIVWRISRKAHAGHPLSGDGARRYGGRWNHVSVPVVYTSQSLSLAVLEYLVNTSRNDLPSDLVAIKIGIPDEFPRSEILVQDLPDDWRQYPAVEELKDIGTDWVRKHETPILLVPSAVIPNEINCLINPTHSLAENVAIMSVEAFSLDQRLLGIRPPARKK